MPRTVSPNPELEKKVSEEAKREHRSFSAQLWLIIQKYFESKTK